MALPQFGEEARDEAARQSGHAETPESYYRRVNREQQHTRQPMAHHKGQIQDVFGGRSAAKHRGDTDAGRGQGRAVSKSAVGVGARPEGIAGNLYRGQPSQKQATDQSEDKDLEYLTPPLIAAGTPSVNDRSRKSLALLRTLAEKRDAEAGIVKQEPLPRDHPSVLAEIKHDKIAQMMQEIPNQNKGNILEEEYDIGDPFVAAPDNDDDYID
jgi:hypothetical protein